MREEEHYCNGQNSKTCFSVNHADVHLSPDPDPGGVQLYKRYTDRRDPRFLHAELHHAVHNAGTDGYDPGNPVSGTRLRGDRDGPGNTGSHRRLLFQQKDVDPDLVPESGACCQRGRRDRFLHLHSAGRCSSCQQGDFYSACGRPRDALRAFRVPVCHAQDQADGLQYL